LELYTRFSFAQSLITFFSHGLDLHLLAGGLAFARWRGRQRQSNGAHMAIDVSYLSAFGAGALSFLSPCVLPLVPPYLCYMAGVNFENFADQSKAGWLERKALILTSLAFVLGFSTVFILLGAGATGIGQFLRSWQDVLAKAAGGVIIIMGLNFLGVFKIGLLSREARLNPESPARSPLSAYVMGLAFAFGWTPCIGPVLGPILTLAGGKETVLQGASLLAVYSAGLGIPFLMAAFFSSRFMNFVRKFRTNMGMVEKVIGVLLVISGVLFLSGGIGKMAFWLLETFPILQTIG
jgi:cytochrome c-type biogenesis protein